MMIILSRVRTWRMCDDDDFVSCRDLVDENQWMRSAKFYVNQQKERRGSNMTRCSNTIRCSNTLRCSNDYCQRGKIRNIRYDDHCTGASPTSYQSVFIRYTKKHKCGFVSFSTDFKY